jgi:hypothetical protein
MDQQHRDDHGNFVMSYDRLATIVPKDLLMEFKHIQDGPRNNLDEELNEEQQAAIGESQKLDTVHLGNEAGQSNIGDGRIKSEILVQAKSTDVRWSRLICDECHILRNTKSGFWRLVNMIPSNYRHLVSATPALDHVKDYCALATLLWNNARLSFDISNPALKSIVAENGYQPDMTSWTFADGTTVHFPSLFDTGSSGQSVAELRKWYDKTQCRFWFMHPEISSLIANDEINNEQRANILNGIIQLCQTRRTLYTPLRLPSGRIICPKYHVPRSRTLMKNVQVPIYLRDTVLSTISKYVDKPSISVTTSAPHTATLTPSNESSQSLTQQGTCTLDSGRLHDLASRPTLNMTHYRMLSNCSFDWRFYTLWIKSDPMMSLDQHEFRPDAGFFVGNKQPEPSRKRKRDDQLEVSVSVDTAPPVNDSQVDSNGGLSWYYNLLNLHPGHPPPSELHLLICWVAAKSPGVIAAMDCVYNNYKEHKRTLILVDSPWAQQ